MLDKRAAIYSRISRDAANEGKGVERQREDCEALCKARGYAVVGVYEDNDTTAAGRVRKARPQYDAMLAAAKAGEFGVIVAYSNSRLTRRPRELEDLLDLHEDHGTVINTVVSGDDNLNTADGRQNARLRVVIDAGEAERIAERVKRQKAQQAAEGRAQGGRYRVFGYTAKEKQPDGTYTGTAWEVIEEEAEIVRDVFQRKASGESTTAIARYLNSQGIKTVNGNRWDSGNLAKLLRKPGYAGLREYGGEIVGTTSYEPIVSESVFAAAQSSTVKRSAGHNTRRHLLSGILVCSKCLESMKGKEASGKRTYVCTPNPGTDACGKTAINMDWVDEAVLSEVWRLQQEQDPVEPEPRTSTDDDESAIGEIRQRIEDLKAAYTAGNLSLPELVELRNGEQAKIAELTKRASETVIENLGLLQPFQDFDDMSLSAKRMFITRYVANVKVLPTVVRGRHVNRNTTRERLEIHPRSGKPYRLGRVEHRDTIVIGDEKVIQVEQ